MRMCVRIYARVGIIEKSVPLVPVVPLWNVNISSYIQAQGTVGTDIYN